MFHGKVTETYDVLWSGRFKHLNFALIVAAYRVTHDINTTVATLKQYITDAENRMDQELEFARQIQLSALPSVFISSFSK